MSPNDDTKTAITNTGSTGSAMTTHTVHCGNSSNSSSSSSCCNGTAASTSIGPPPPIVDLGTKDVEPVDDNNNDSSNTHIRNMMEQRYGERLVIPEWEQEEEKEEQHPTNSIITSTTTTNHHTTTYRSQHGWKGNDLIHSSLTSNVHLMDTYYVKYNTTTNTTNTTHNHHAIGTKVTGRVHFTQNAESHRGYCHGGAACSIMDDIIGWTAFCCGDTTTSLSLQSPKHDGNDRMVIPTTTNGHSCCCCCCIPWSGYTVQVNTKLCRPIPIAAQLYIQGTITNIVRRKVYVTAVLYDDDDDDDPLIPHTDDMNEGIINTTTEEHRIIYATGEGIVVMNHGIL